MLNDSSHNSFVDRVKRFPCGMGFKPDVVENLVKDNAPRDPEAVPGGTVHYNVSYTPTPLPRSVAVYEEQESLIREAEAFVAVNPDYTRCMPNFDALTAYMVAAGMSPVRENFQVAYDHLKREGKMVLNNPVPVYYDRRAVENLRVQTPRLYSNRDSTANAAFEVSDWKNISDIKLSKVKQPVVTKEPGSRRFLFEQEEQ